MLNGGITMRELIERTEVSVGTAYSLIEDIELYIADFYRYDLELLKFKGKYTIKIKK